MEKFLSKQFDQLTWLKDQEVALVGIAVQLVMLHASINLNIHTLLAVSIIIQ